MTWQTIKTAPFGRPVMIAWLTPNGKQCVAEAWMQLETPIVENKIGDKVGVNKLIRYWSFDYDGLEDLYYPPTHWMEIPDPPPLDEMMKILEGEKND